MVTACCLFYGPEWSIVRLWAPFSKPTHPIPPLARLRQGGQILMTRELRTPHGHMSPLWRACHLQGVAPRSYLAFSHLHNPLPLAPFSIPVESPQGLTLTFFNFGTGSISSSSNVNTVMHTVGHLMTIGRISIKSILQRKGWEGEAILVSQKLAFSPRSTKVIPVLPDKTRKHNTKADLFICWRIYYNNKSSIKSDISVNFPATEAVGHELPQTRASSAPRN